MHNNNIIDKSYRMCAILKIASNNKNLKIKATLKVFLRT